jgi:hypothetical protein
VLGFPRPGERAAADAKERALTLAIEADRMSSSADIEYPLLVAQLALELDRKEPFQAAVRTLERKYPGELPTHYFAAISAATDEDWAKAESEIEKAKAKGLADEAAEQFLSSGVRARASGATSTGCSTRRRLGRWGFWRCSCWGRSSRI